jgi:hypothetical protein
VWKEKEEGERVEMQAREITLFISINPISSSGHLQGRKLHRKP